jgi:hypothetical protein
MLTVLRISRIEIVKNQGWLFLLEQKHRQHADWAHQAHKYAGPGPGSSPGSGPVFSDSFAIRCTGTETSFPGRSKLEGCQEASGPGRRPVGHPEVNSETSFSVQIF